MTPQEKANAVRDYALSCNGTENRWRHGLARRLTYSDGVKFLAETCGAYWLVDIVASYVATTRAVQNKAFQLWRLDPTEYAVRVVYEDGNEEFKLWRDGARVVCEDGNENVIITQDILCTDFPRELMPFKLFCENGGDDWLLMLPEER
jgi:hypothetical protein